MIFKKTLAALTLAAVPLTTAGVFEAAAGAPVSATVTLAPYVDYTVKKGDTLGAIAKRYKTTVSTLVKLNSIKNANLIRVGQVLRVPSDTTVKPPVLPPVPPPVTKPPVVTPPTTPNSLRCEVKSGDSHLQEWPAKVRTRIREQFHVATIGGYRATASGEHGKGFALDVMTYKDVKKGRGVRQWAVEHAEQLNIYYVIFEQTIYGKWNGWKGEKMANRGSVTANHFDHVHISFNPGMGTCPAN